MRKLLTSLLCLLISVLTLLSCVACTDKTNSTAQNNNLTPPSETTDTPNENGGSTDTPNTPTNDPIDNNGNNSNSSSSQFPSFSTGAVVSYNFNKSGTIRSSTGTNLNLYVDWSASSNNGKLLKVRFTVGIESYSIQVGARDNLGKFKLNGTTYTYSTSALTIADNRKKVKTDFYTFEEEYEFTKGETLSFDIVASWVFNGVYGGTPLETLVAGDTVRLEMPK